MQIEDIKVGDKVQLIDNHKVGTVVKVTAARVRVEVFSEFHGRSHKELTAPKNLRKL